MWRRSACGSTSKNRSSRCCANAREARTPHQIVIGPRGSGKTSSVAIGPERMRARIRSLPSANLLPPLTTALERELGLEPRAAREVEEIAQDIRRGLAKLRGATPEDPGCRQPCSGGQAR